VSQYFSMFSRAYCVPDEIPTLANLFTGRRILVMGDVMLDRFVYGHVGRISPEAPVPVLVRSREEIMLGGAGNVARNIAALGGTAILIGAVGDDNSSKLLRAQIAATPCIQDKTITLVGMTTTEKVRYVCQQQLLRVDSEQNEAVSLEAIRDVYDAALNDADIVILSDYAKGVLTPHLLCHAIAGARSRNIPLLVDPKVRDLSRYDGALLITPNLHEAEAATGIKIMDDNTAAQAAQCILELTPNTAAVVITRGEKGMTLLERGIPPKHLKTQARKVFDVSGAGDTVMGTLALSLAAGLNLAEATRFANTAAGIAVGKPGTATVDAGEIQRELRAARVHNAEDKIVSVEVANSCIAAWRSRREKVGFTNGCFDLIHPGHISLLAQARAQCDHLVVGLNSDASVRRLKGSRRPIQDEVARAIVIASLESVEIVVIFNDDTPLELVKALRPDVLIKGQDYKAEDVVGAKEVQSWGGEVVLAQLTPGHSTTKTVARMLPS
jgi:D-beta-D-heptose 7-phosphate kinase/D-beta-D-heptose 1-phosphate adenosyltransferase